jgi:hypothetical protein
MRAFAKAEFLANRVVSWFGYDADEIAKALIGYSNEIPTAGEGRALYHDQLAWLSSQCEDRYVTCPIY